MTTDKDRAEFEAWARSEGLNPVRSSAGGYMELACAGAWFGWDAARSRSGAVPAEWRSPSDPPSGEKGRWSRDVLAVTVSGAVFRIAHFHGEGGGHWQRTTAMALLDKTDVIIGWTEIPPANFAAPEPPQGYAQHLPDFIRRDGFHGDTAQLCASIDALLALDAKNALVPHGLGGHARTLLEAAANRLHYPDTPRSGDAPALLLSRDELIRHDDYGVYGSDFFTCRLCDKSSGAGLLNKGIDHEGLCPLHPNNVGRYTAPPADATRGVVAAWHTEDGRTISAKQKADALRGGGASASSVASYTRPSYFGAAPVDARDGGPEIRNPECPGCIALSEAERRNAADAEDARRYRWLRDCDIDHERSLHYPNSTALLAGKLLDDAIDRAMGTKGERDGR